MKRFTEKRGGENAIPLRSAVCGLDIPYWKISNNDIETFLYGDAADRLAAYEETGFEPEEVAQIRNALKLQSLMVDEARKYWLLQEHGRLIILPCKIGAKVRDINADYVFTVEKAETCTVYGKPAIIFRCGNPGTNDYTAFYDFEIGKNIEILPEE